jgi:hypothetical protein
MNGQPKTNVSEDELEDGETKKSERFLFGGALGSRF